MLISVIVPVYNVEKYLKECVDSIINQSYKNIEILLIDDNSLDNSGKICDEYLKIDPRIKVFHKKNEGLGLTRNFGILKSTGDYIMFLDSDDYIAEDMIEKLLNEVNNNNLDYIKSGFIRFRNNSILSKNNYSKEIINDKDDIKKISEKMLGSLPNKSDMLEMGVPASLYKRNIIIENNILFPSERELISEDLIFNLAFLDKCSNIEISDYLGYYYRYNLTSLSKRYKDDRFVMCRKYYKYLENYIINNNFSDEAILRLKKTFFIYVRMCISQEKKSISKKSSKDIKNSIIKICNDELVKDCINSYPINNLGIKQRFFTYLIKNKLYNFIYMMINFI